MLATPETQVRTQATSGNRASSGNHRRKQSRSRSVMELREREMRLFLEQAQESFCGIHLGCHPPRVKLGREEVLRRRNSGMHTLIEVYMQVRPSARTLALAVHLWDKLLAKTIEEAPVSTRANDQHRADGRQSPIDCGAPVHDSAVAASQIYDSMLESEDAAVKPRSFHCPDAGLPKTDSLEAPLSCFVVACKCVETFSPRLVDVARAVGDECSAQQIRDAENQVLALLSFDVNDTTGAAKAGKEFSLGWIVLDQIRSDGMR